MTENHIDSGLESAPRALTSAWKVRAASAFVIFSFAALLAMPLLFAPRIQESRTRLAEVIEPARTALGQLELSIARQEAALRSFRMTGRREILELYGELRNEETQRLERLAQLVVPLGAPYPELVSSLRLRVGQWHARQQAMLGTPGGDAAVREEVSYEHVLPAALELERRLAGQARAERERARRLESAALFLVVLLSGLAAASAALVAWSAHRFHRRAREEERLQQSALTLVKAIEVGEVLQRIVRAAAALDRDGSAYVERLVESEDAVEVVAAAGPQAPDPGTRAALPGSVPRPNLQSGLPEIIDDTLNVELPMLRSVCGGRRCSAIVVPLVADRQAYGALVVVRPRRRLFGRVASVAQARTLGAFAALALRKAVLLQESEERHQRLRESTERRARLLRGFSHDVKNPLGAADGQAALLEEGIVADAGQVRESARRIRRSLGTALRLIDDLVQLARAEAGHLDVTCVPVDACTLVRRTVEEFAGAAAAAGLQLEAPELPESAALQTDVERVTQILGNLLANAIKYTPAGGAIRLGVTIAQGERGVDPDSWVKISVADTGPGIRPEDLRLLFREFTRFSPDQSSGTGLGLAISDRIARLLGGQITVVSEVGRGSTFTLWLPRAPGGDVDSAG